MEKFSASYVTQNLSEFESDSENDSSLNLEPSTDSSET